MTRRRFVRSSALAGLSFAASSMLNFGRARLFAADSATVSTRAIDVVRGAVVIDMLGLLTLDWAKMFRWQHRAHAFGDADFNTLQHSGVKIFHPAVDTGITEPVRVAHAWLQGWSRLLGSQVCRLSRVDTASDLLRIPETKRIGVIVGFQNSNHFGAAADVHEYFRRGQRVSQLTYNERNRLGSGCYERRDHGLTSYGAEIVAAMNETGMAIDVSHCGERTSLDACEASRKPVLVTHGNCKALNPGQPRCKSDAVIRNVAATGGVIGIATVAAFVGRSPTLDDLLDHFLHAVKVAGIEHVGLGSDVDVEGVDPRSGRPHPFYSIQGLDPAARVFQIADGLLRRGLTPHDVELVLGGNFIRALSATWPRESPELVAQRMWRRDPFCPASARQFPQGVKSAPR